MGYAALAKLMSRHSQLAIFRGFSDLNTKNLLYFQAELIELENELNRKQHEQRNQGDQGIQGIQKEVAEEYPNILDQDWKSLKMAETKDSEKS